MDCGSNSTRARWSANETDAIRTPGSFSIRLWIVSAHPSQFIPSILKIVVFITDPLVAPVSNDPRLTLGPNSKVKPANDSLALRKSTLAFVPAHMATVIFATARRCGALGVHIGSRGLVRAGAFSGLVAGGVSAIAYSLHCTDDSLPFVALWYGGTIVLCTPTGALLGPRLLRW